MFSALWGSQQLLTVLLYAIVLVRYRNLVPLMYGLFVLEVVLRGVVGSIHPLSPDHYLRTPPGAVANLPMLLLSACMLVLSLRERARDGTAAGAKPLEA